KAAPFKEWYEQQENKQLVELLGAMFSDEVFVYGDRNTATFLSLLSEMNSANQAGPIMALFQGRNIFDVGSPQFRARLLLQALSDHSDLIGPPNLVFGFKLRDTAPANAQLARLDAIVQQPLQQAPPLQGRWTKAKRANGDFYTLQLDGELVPWDR